jgi:hypothetical protein
MCLIQNRGLKSILVEDAGLSQRFADVGSEQPAMWRVQEMQISIYQLSDIQRNLVDSSDNNSQTILLYTIP